MAADTKGKKGKKQEAADPAAPRTPAPPPRLKVRYRDEIKAKLAQEFGLPNPMSHPRLEAVVVNINMGRHLDGNKLPPNVKNTVLETLTTITGQKPVVIKAKKSVSNFKVREGYETSAKVTLRGDRMWHFLDRLINLAVPRIKDFRGVKTTAFDRNGSYALGLSEQGVFPEIDMAKAVFTHGMNINICFRNSSPDISTFILKELGMPFRKDKDKDNAA